MEERETCLHWAQAVFFPTHSPRDRDPSSTHLFLHDKLFFEGEEGNRVEFFKAIFKAYKVSRVACLSRPCGKLEGTAYPILPQ